MINLKFLVLDHFKMESLTSLKDVLTHGDYMCKIDLKDAYISVPLAESSCKFVRFTWAGELYEFKCLCFGLGQAPRCFTTLLKVPIALLRRLGMKLAIYLDDILLMGSSLEEVKQARDTLIFLLQNLGLVINQKKCVMDPTQFHGYDLVIDSGKIRQSKNLVHGDVRESKDICPKFNLLNRTPHINRSSCASSKTPDEISATGSDKSFKNFKIIHEDFRIIKGGTAGTGLVGTESGTLQWESYI